MDENKAKATEKPEKKFPANNYTDIKPLRKEPERRSGDPVERTGKGKVREKKRTVGERIADNFLATDSSELKEHFIFDWLIPGIKTIVEDLVHMILYGSGASNDIRRERGRSEIRRVPYNSIYDGRRRNEEYIPARRGNRNPELIFDYRSDAEQVLSGINEYIDDYGSASMKDFYSIVSEVSDGRIDIPTDFQMTQWGWYDVTTASIAQVRGGGWMLRMPKAEVIKR